MLKPSITHSADVNIFRHELFQEDTIGDVYPTLYTILEGTPGALFPDSPRLVRTVGETEFNDLVANPAALGPNQFLASTPFAVFFGDFPFEFAQSFRRYDIDYQVDATWMDNQVFSAGYEYLEEKDPTETTFFDRQQRLLRPVVVHAGTMVRHCGRADRRQLAVRDRGQPETVGRRVSGPHSERGPSHRSRCSSVSGVVSRTPPSESCFLA